MLDVIEARELVQWGKSRGLIGPKRERIDTPEDAQRFKQRECMRRLRERRLNPELMNIQPEPVPETKPKLKLRRMRRSNRKPKQVLEAAA